MSAKYSAGILPFRMSRTGIEVLLGHMGGPFWSSRDAGAWSVPKGEHQPDEDPWDAAQREFREELGIGSPTGRCLALDEVRQSGGKVVRCWAVEGEIDPAAVVPGTFEMEWPRGSGRMREFPELDRVAWFSLAQARDRLVASQRPFLDRLAQRLRV